MAGTATVQTLQSVKTIKYGTMLHQGTKSRLDARPLVLQRPRGLGRPLNKGSGLVGRAATLEISRLGAATPLPSLTLVYSLGLYFTMYFNRFNWDTTWLP